jgi:[ribosomal protein S5]-alanine N-acetyltransferase
MSAPAVIETERLRLRPLTLEDAPTVQQLAGRREIAAMTLSIPHPYSLEQAQDWLAKRLSAVAEGKTAVFGIVLKGTGRLIGAVGLGEIDADHSRAEMGFWIGVDWWGQGYATEASRAVVRYGFEQLKLNRIYAHHMTKNPASGRVLERVGLRREGLLRQAMRKFGQFEDVILYAVLREDWRGTPHPSPDFPSSHSQATMPGN